MSGESAAEMDTKHKTNSATIVAQMAANNARVAALPAPVGHAGEPPLNTKFMQGTANGVVPDAYLTHRI